jgi:hypothetical protein
LKIQDLRAYKELTSGFIDHGHRELKENVREYTQQGITRAADLEEFV